MAASVATPVACPQCGTMLAAGTKFCTKCGAALAAPTAPPASVPAVSAPAAPMPAPTVSTPASPSGASAPPIDLREKVDADRGVIKRLQLLVPGYRSYREGEDIREADSLLRLQVADKVKNARATVENTRQALVQANQFTALNDLAPLIADLWKLEGEIRHAEQGYTGISPAVRINAQQIDRLYEYDFGFAQAGDQLSQTVASMPGLAMGPNASQVGSVIATARGQVNQLDQAFKARIQAIEGIRVS
jgi:zinc-ribbon domain